MKKLIFLLTLAAVSCQAAFTEFYVQGTGNNLNAGSTTANSAVYTAVGDSDGTSVFTPSDGSTPASSVSAGDWVSVYVTSGATVATFVGRVTTVAAGVNGAVTVSTVAKAGTFPAASGGAHTISLKAGGAWAGPSGAVGFPFNFAAGTMTNSSGNSPRFNFKAGTYSITAAITDAVNAGARSFWGYTTTPGDGGFAIIDGGTTGTSYNLLILNGKNLDVYYFKFQNNGATGSADGVTTSSGTENSFSFCVFHDLRGSGLTFTTVNHAYFCEAFNCDQSNTTTKGGFDLTSSGCTAYGCIAHHNTAANCAGFQLDGGINLLYCIAAFNGASGFRTTADVTQTMAGCSLYGNGGYGIEFAGNAGLNNDPMLVNVVNCMIVSNTTAGIGVSQPNAMYLNGHVMNCAFGTGTQTNSGGNFYSNVKGVSQDGSTINGLWITGTITLPLNEVPWNAPTTGDFKITSSTAKGSGYENYTQTYTGSTWTGTVGYPDVGAAQAQCTGGTGGQKSSIFVQ